jgi:AcrR family transcriptional regulator
MATDASMATKPGAGGRPKVGRPPKVDRAMIAEAASELGLDQVTMKAVAARLGVSVTGLYHHVSGRDELLRLAAEHTAAKMTLPVDRGQHWTEWLLEWALYSYDEFVALPGLLGQFVGGGIGVERMLTHIDTAIGVLARQGFEPADALDAYQLVTGCALGGAVAQLRDSQAAEAGRPVIAEYHQVLAQLPPDALPHLRSLVGAQPRSGPDIVEQIKTVLIGIAVRRGESWEPILDLRRPTPPS